MAQQANMSRTAFAELFTATVGLPPIQYLAHWRAHHAGAGEPLDRSAFFKAEQERKWNGIKRCC